MIIMMSMINSVTAVAGSIYDNGRYAARSEMMEPEDRGYRRYSDGRFAPRNDGGMWVESNYWDDRMTGPQSHYPYYMPPAYTDRRR